MFENAWTQRAHDKSKRYTSFGLFSTKPNEGHALLCHKDKARWELKEFSSIPGVTLAIVEGNATRGFRKRDGTCVYPNMAKRSLGRAITFGCP